MRTSSMPRGCSLRTAKKAEIKQVGPPQKRGGHPKPKGKTMTQNQDKPLWVEGRGPDIFTGIVLVCCVGILTFAILRWGFAG